MTVKKKTLSAGNGISSARASWDFSGTVASTFEEHVRSSVPMYEEGHQLICELSDFFVKKDSTCYDLGCSTGTLLEKLSFRHDSKPEVRWLGVDSEIDMLNVAESRFKDSKLSIELLHEDLSTFNFCSTDLVTAYYTMQFIPPSHRQSVINSVFEALRWGGAFIVYEKVRGSDARFQDYFSQIYSDYKMSQGYSPEEIINKASSLKSVLEPFSTQGNLDLFERAGFKDVISIQKWLCFEGFLCIK